MDSNNARRRSTATELHVATDAAISRIRSAIRSRNSPRQLKNDSETIEEIDRILEELDATLQTNLGGDLDLSEDDGTRVVKLQTPNDDNRVWQPGLQPSPPITVRQTHPTTFKPHDHHIDAIETFEKDLLEAKVCNDAKPVTYTKVEVLLVTWRENDDIEEEVQEEVKALKKLFRKLNFTVRPYEIPNVNCQNELLFEVLSFLKPHQNDPSGETLLIVYYNGHGSIRNRETSYWHPTAWAATLSDPRDLSSRYNGPAVEWNAIQELFGPDTTPDTLFILDCCYAGAAIKHQPTGHAMELLAACGSGDRTEAGDDSFTMRVVQCMKEMRKMQGSFQVAWLYESLINASQTPTPIHIKLNRSLYSITLPKLDTLDTNSNPSAKPTATNELLYPPSLKGARRSSSPGSIHAPEGSIFSEDDYVLDGITSASSVISESIALEENWQYNVLLTVKLRSNIVPRAANWCLSFPSSEVEGLEGVRVESLYPTKSTLLLVTMPVRLWVHLREDPAYTFIDFVKTGNMLIPGHSQTDLLAPVYYPSVGTKGANDNDGKEIASTLATMQNFFEKTKNQDLCKKQKPPGTIAHKCKQIVHKLHLPSQLKSEQDPTFNLVQQVVEQINIHRNGKGEYTGVINYNSYFNLQIKQRFENSKNSMKDALHQANTKGNIDLDNTLTTQIDELETDVVDMTRLEVEKMVVKNYFERGLSTSPASTFDLVESKKRKYRTKVVKPQQQYSGSTPDDQRMKPASANSSSIPRTDSIAPMHPSPRIDSGRWLRGESSTPGKRKSGIFGK